MEQNLLQLISDLGTKFETNILREKYIHTPKYILSSSLKTNAVHKRKVPKPQHLPYSVLGSRQVLPYLNKRQISRIIF